MNDQETKDEAEKTVQEKDGGGLTLKSQHISDQLNAFIRIQRYFIEENEAILKDTSIAKMGNDLYLLESLLIKGGSFS